MLNILFLFACFEFKNDFAVDNDNDGLTEYDGDCDDNDGNIGLLECSDDDGDGFSEYQGDCDDTEPLTFPGAAEIDSETDCMKDLDEDGYGDSAVESAVVGGSDCNDEDAAISPAVDEVCDEVDNNCDDIIDEDTAVDALTWYRDTDGDGFGDAEAPTNACTQPQDYVENADDCNDLEAAVNPDANEVCDPIDNDCDGLIDDDDDSTLTSTMTTWYIDADNDGYGNLSNAITQCAQPDGYLTDFSDCNDSDGAINPSATEVCDSLDNNCDSQIDDADNDLDPTTTTTFYQDNDNDGFGSTVTENACIQPSGFVNTPGDCNDAVFAINPNGTEICDNLDLDEDCDGSTEDSDSSVDYQASGITYYRDADSDTFGNLFDTILACAVPVGYVTNSTDCNDNDEAINPDAIEVCDSMDNNCDTQVDDNDNDLDPTSQLTYHLDADNDGYGNSIFTHQSCLPPPGYVANGDDCNDSITAINPGVFEECGDNIDNNCDTFVDDPTSIDAAPWYLDSDSDGYGDPLTNQLSCTQPSTYVSDNTDCDDSTSSLLSSTFDGDCDGVLTADDCDDGDPNTIYDMDCDGAVVGDDCDDFDDTYGDIANDQDCDGWITAQDCDDNDAFTYPGVAYLDSSTDCMTDGDGDGFGNLHASGTVTPGSDCNDEDEMTNPNGFDLLLTERTCDGRIETPNSLGFAESIYFGHPSDESVGYSVSSAGDVDGDGLDDVLIGAKETTNNLSYGKLYLMLGSNLAQGNGISLENADYIFITESSGTDISTIDVIVPIATGAGDVDGDGLDDILIGALFNDDGGVDAGKTYLVLGKSLGLDPVIDLAQSDYVFVGEETLDKSGHSVSFAGDVDGDGLDDILIGAYYSNHGSSVYAGKTYLVLASSLGSNPTVDLSQADYIFWGENEWDWSGYSVSDAGDVDGDGLGDILIGAYYNSDGGFEAGKTYLILGSSLGLNTNIDLSLADYTFLGENVSNRSGNSVSSAGDVDGDGLDDILIGSYWNYELENEVGKSYLILGSSLGLQSTVELSLADYSFTGEEMGDNSGWMVSGGGDVDGDGLSDFLIGALNNDEGGISAGKTYLILGSSLGSVSDNSLSSANFAFIGENPDDNTGHSASFAGDVNGDGLDDILVGAFGNDDFGLQSGKAYLVMSGLTNLDDDNDGVPFYEDCNDSDPGTINDMDCDGLTKNLDCNDFDPLMPLLDNDCDGSPTGIDCDDFNDLVQPNGQDDLFIDRTCDGFVWASVSNSDYTFVGTAAFEGAGYNVDTVGDVDGDGLVDILIGAPYDWYYSNQYSAGKAYLVLGSSLYSSTPFNLSDADYIFLGENSADQVGKIIRAAGDVDGDGLDDFFIGSRKAETNGNPFGKVYLVLASSLGSNQTFHLSQSDYVFIGENFGIRSGIGNVSNAGDVNGDGYVDMLFDVPGAEYYSGKVYLFLGGNLGQTREIYLTQADHVFIGESRSDRLKVSTKEPGDVDGDGLADILLGSYDSGNDYRGKSYLFYGANLGSQYQQSLSSADHYFYGEESGDAAGYSSSIAGDIDGDGRDDILIGAYNNDEGGEAAGKTYLILSSNLDPHTDHYLAQADFTFVGENQGDNTGSTVASGGDIDGDGLDDVLIGALGYDGSERENVGAAFVFLGSDIVSQSTTISSAGYQFIGERQDDRLSFANALDFAGDVNGDGLSDLIMGSYENSQAGTEAGKAYLILSGL